MEGLKIKVCGMKYSKNIEAVAALQPNYMGFIFYEKSTRFVSEALDPATINSLPKKIKPVGVFVNENLQKMLQKANQYSLEAVQLHGDESPAYCKEAKENGKQIIKAFQLHDGFNFDKLKAYEPICDFFLFDTKSKQYGGSGKQFNWKILKKYKLNIPYFLSGGVSAQNIQQLQILNLPLQPYAIDVNSKFETAPAEKNVELLKKFLKGK